MTCHRVNRKKLNIHTCENMRLDKQKKRNITYPVRSYETSPELPCWSGITSPVICLERISKATSAASKYINFYYIRSTLICIYTLFHITFCISPKHQYQPDGVDIYYPLYHRESRSFVVQYEISKREIESVRDIE